MAVEIALAQQAKRIVLSAADGVKRLAARRWPSEKITDSRDSPTPLPPAKDLDAALAILGEIDDVQHPDTAPIRRDALSGVVRNGFASHNLRSAFLAVHNTDDEPIGHMVFHWMEKELERYKIELRRIEDVDARRAVEMVTAAIRFVTQHFLGVTIPDPENLRLHACRGRHPADVEYLTMVKATGDYLRPFAELAKVYDPRNWDKNPYAVHFTDVHPVTGVSGSTKLYRTEPIGTTWDPPSWISERVERNGSFLVNTLMIEYVVTATWLRLTYELGKTTGSSSTLAMEQDFGCLDVYPVPGRPGWHHIALEKNIRFSGNTGTGGGNIGWGDLANLLAPDLVAHWLEDMHGMPYWTPP